MELFLLILQIVSVLSVGGYTVAAIVMAYRSEDMAAKIFIALVVLYFVAETSIDIVNWSTK